MSKLEHPDKQYVLVVWDDAHGNSSNDVTEATMKHEPMRYHTYGWIMRSDPIGVTIAAEWCVSDETYRSTTFIPRPMVVNEIPMRLSRFTKREKNATDNSPISV